MYALHIINVLNLYKYQLVTSCFEFVQLFSYMVTRMYDKILFNKHFRFFDTSVINFLELATTAALPGGARNVEFGHHCLQQADGDIEVSPRECEGRGATTTVLPGGGGATTAALPGGARNVEFGHHCLQQADGDIEVSPRECEGRGATTTTVLPGGGGQQQQRFQVEHVM